MLLAAAKSFSVELNIKRSDDWIKASLRPALAAFAHPCAAVWLLPAASCRDQLCRCR